MANDHVRAGNGILGDIDPAPEPQQPESGEPVRDRSDDDKPATESAGGTVDTGTGGSRNYHSNTGAAGSDIGNRPE